MITKSGTSQKIKLLLAVGLRSWLVLNLVVGVSSWKRWTLLLIEDLYLAFRNTKEGSGCLHWYQLYLYLGLLSQDMII